jgi:hypothetical protein
VFIESTLRVLRITSKAASSLTYWNREAGPSRSAKLAALSPVPVLELVAMPPLPVPATPPPALAAVPLASATACLRSYIKPRATSEGNQSCLICVTLDAASG